MFKPIEIDSILAYDGGIYNNFPVNVMRDDFQIERMYKPIFTLKGNFVPAQHFNLLAELSCKPVGIFHGSANFYALYTRLGFIYTW